MFRNKSLEEKRLEQIRKKWKNYQIPLEVRNQFRERVKSFAEASLSLIRLQNLMGYANTKKVSRYEEEFTKHLGVLARDCFLVGMEFGTLTITDEVRPILCKASEIINQFMISRIRESIELGFAPREDCEKIIRTTLGLVVDIVKTCYETGSSYHFGGRQPNPSSGVKQYTTLSNSHLPKPRDDEQSRESDVDETTSSDANKIRYIFSHVYIPEMAFEASQRMYENLADKNGELFLIGLWQRLAARLGTNILPIGLRLSKRIMDKNYEAYIIQMPKPIVVPEAFWAVITFELDYQTITPKVITIRYFTLELGKNPYEQGDEYHFCEWATLHEHVNYGKLSGTDENIFLEAVYSTLHLKPIPSLKINTNITPPPKKSYVDLISITQDKKIDENKPSETPISFSGTQHAIHAQGRLLLRDLYQTLGEALPEYRAQIQKDIVALEAWADVKDGKWTDEQVERFARQFELYVAEWMPDLIPQISQTEYLNPVVREILNRMHGRD